MRKITWNNVECFFQGEIHITYKSSGYYDQGKYFGAPENCYEAEYDDERFIVSMSIDGKVLPPELVKALEPFFEGQLSAHDGPDVQAIEDDYYENCDPDPEY